MKDVSVQRLSVIASTHYITRTVLWSRKCNSDYGSEEFLNNLGEGVKTYKIAEFTQFRK